MMCIHVLLHHYIYVLCVYSSTIIGVFESELQLLALIFFQATLACMIYLTFGMPQSGDVSVTYAKC